MKGEEMKRNFKKVVALTASLMMVASTFAPTFADSTKGFVDISGHWAENTITAWSGKGLAKGYEDGSFRPENGITRAEFISLVNRSFGFTEKAPINYKDVKDSHWAYNEFAVAQGAGYIGGYEDGSLRPNGNITRQEMASVISRLAKLETATDSQAYKNLKDIKDIPEWSAGAVSAVVDNGITNLRDGSFKPAVAATRAEVVYSLDKSLLSKVSVTYNEAGTYTAGIVNGSLEINAKNVVLEDTTIKGDLIINEKVGDGDVTLNNVTVEGSTIVKGGGMNTVKLNDSKLERLILAKLDGKVRILVSGSTFVDTVLVRSGGKIQATDLKAKNIGKLIVEEKTKADLPLILAASIESVELNGAGLALKVEGGTIKVFIVSKTAEGVKVDLSKDAVIKKAELTSKPAISGSGKIESATGEGSKGIVTNPATPPAGGGGGGGGPSTPSENLVTYKFVVAKDGTTGFTFEKAFKPSTPVNFSMINDLYKSIPSDRDISAAMNTIEDLLALKAKSSPGKTYAQILAEKLKGGNPELKVLNKDVIKGAIKNIADGTDVENNIKTLAENLLGKDLGEILKDLRILFPSEPLPSQVKIYLLDSKVAMSNPQVADLQSSIDNALNSNTIGSLVGKEILKVKIDGKNPSLSIKIEK